MAINYVGPYSPAVYDAAEKVQSTGTGAPYSPNILDAAQNVISLQNDPYYSGGGSGGGGGAPVNQNTPEQQAAIDREMQLRSEIEGGWNSYLGELDNIIGGLGSQRSAQENIAQNQYQQGVNTLGLQRDQGLTTLGNEETKTKQTQKKTLRDLSENIRNSFQAGNVYLGARGAADSSAADQYSYALTKLGTQKRTDVMNNTANIINDINQRKENLTNIYNTESKNLKLQLDSQINQIAQWFQQAQQQLQMQKAQGQLGRSQDLASLSKDLLNNALSAANQVKTQYAQNQAGLDQWANSLTGELAKFTDQAQTISNPTYNTDYNTNIAGTPQTTANGGLFTPAGYGFNTEERYNNLLNTVR